MHLVYIDEVKWHPSQDPYYWLCALAIKETDVLSVESSLNNIAARYFAYIDPAHEPIDEHLRAELKRVPSARLASETGLTTRSIRNIRNGHQRPTAQNEQRLRRAVARYEGPYLGDSDVLRDSSEKKPNSAAQAPPVDLSGGK